MKNRTYNRHARHILSAPFIWTPLIGIILVDVLLEIYHRVCFPLYRIPYVSRRSYIQIDRHKLRYLSMTEKMGCMYCGYVNGWLAYATVIAAETERYWCGIQHQRNARFRQPQHHQDFVPYGDADALHQKYDSPS